MPRVRLIHWKKTEADGYVETLTKAGYQVDYDEQFRPDLMRSWRRSPPDAFVIDLSRLPSHGREIAIALRQSSATRAVPIVFCAGETEKVEAIRALLPDAAYCEFSKLKATVRKAIAAQVKDPVRPTAMMDRYRSRTTAEKLGIKEGSLVALTNAPRDVQGVLGPLPEKVRLAEDEGWDPSANVHVCFIEGADQLSPVLSQVRPFASRSKLWIAWRKGGKAAAGHVTEKLVRERALDLGLVDYKICSLNEVWSAMLFALKR